MIVEQIFCLRRAGPDFGGTTFLRKNGVKFAGLAEALTGERLYRGVAAEASWQSNFCRSETNRTLALSNWMERDRVNRVRL
jgi:hypothetical protein